MTEDDELGCADCAAPNDGTWPTGSDICSRCWEQAEADLQADEDVIQELTVAEALICPPTCQGGVRQTCTRRPNWRVREHGDRLPRNWLWVCHRHLAAACADFGEQAEVDVVRVGC